MERDQSLVLRPEGAVAEFAAIAEPLPLRRPEVEPKRPLSHRPELPQPTPHRSHVSLSCDLCSVAIPSDKAFSLLIPVKRGCTFEVMQSHILTPNDYQRACGERLRHVIELLGLSFKEAAELMNVSKHVLNHWMKGNHPIAPYAAYRLCRSRGVTFDYIFLGDWSSLPHKLARVFEQELALDPSRVEQGRADVESS